MLSALQVFRDVPVLARRGQVRVDHSCKRVSRSGGAGGILHSSDISVSSSERDDRPQPRRCQPRGALCYFRP
jgi:hypothetical protein